MIHLAEKHSSTQLFVNSQ